MVQPDDLRWHVPSTRFDPDESPKLGAFRDHVAAAMSYHGFGRSGFERTVLVGGTNTRLRAVIVSAIVDGTELRVLTGTEEIPDGLAGRHQRNPVNMTEHGGVRIEMSPQAREPAALRKLVDAVAGVLVDEGRTSFS